MTGGRHRYHAHPSPCAVAVRPLLWDQVLCLYDLDGELIDDGGGPRELVRELVRELPGRPEATRPAS